MPCDMIKFINLFKSVKYEHNNQPKSEKKMNNPENMTDMLCLSTIV